MMENLAKTIDKKKVKISPTLVSQLALPSAVFGGATLLAQFIHNEAIQISLTVGGAIGMIGLGVFGTLKLSNLIYSMSRSIQSLEEGNATNTIKGKGNDEFSRMVYSLNQASNNINTMFTGFQEGMEQMSNRTDELSATMTETNYLMVHVKDTTKELTQGTNELSASTQEISASAEEIEQTTYLLAKKAVQGGKLSENIKKRASDVREQAMKASQTAYEMYNEKEEKIIDAIQRVQVVEEINSMANAIGKIAEQTNLLALNASIEAARAGENGRGFSVVADEVRKLAEQSANSVNNIRKITNEVAQAVENLTVNTKEILSFIDDKVKPDYQTMIEIGEQYEKDAEEVEQISNEIAVSSNQMATAIGEVNMSIQNVSATIHQSSVGTAQILDNVSEATLAVEEASKNVKLQLELMENLNKLASQSKN